MSPLTPQPLQFLLVALAGWVNQQQRDVIDYLQAENRVLREQLGPRRLRFTDDQRVRLAAKAKRLPRRVGFGRRASVRLAGAAGRRGASSCEHTGTASSRSTSLRWRR